MKERMLVKFELKAVGENGEFNGVASPYGNKDLGNDIVDKGAFSKTIAERGTKVRLLDSHKVRIGIAEVAEASASLQMKGKINLEKQVGRDAYSDLKFYQENGQPMGLSIGYQTVKAEHGDDGARHLKEVRLFEVSVTEFPMNEAALITGVKSAAFKKDFTESLATIQTLSSFYAMYDALRNSLVDVIYSGDSREEKIAAAEVILQQFSEAFSEFFPGYLDALAEEYGIKDLSKHRLEVKIGEICRGSSPVREKLLALVEGEAGNATSQTKAAEQPEPDSHSDDPLKEIRELIPS